MRMQIAIVGAPEVIAGFALLGVEIIPVHTQAEVLPALLKLKRKTALDDRGIERQVYGIIFITEELMRAIPPEEERKLARGALPAIIPLPSYREGSSYGLERLQRIVEQAIGSNILQ